MFEITLSTNLSKAKDISYLVNNLRPVVKSLRGIMVCEEFDRRVKLAIAVNENKSEQLLGSIFDAIAECIVLSYKEEFLKRNLQVCINDEVTRAAFFKALATFDKNGDKEFIKKHLRVADEILIDSLYSFRLWELENRWKEVCHIVEDNSGYLMMAGSFTELMRFLIMSSDAKFGEVSLNFNGGNVVASALDGKQLFKKAFKDENKELIDLICALIELGPDKISVHGLKQNTKLYCYLSSIFDGKVCYLK